MIKVKHEGEYNKICQLKASTFNFGFGLKFKNSQLLKLTNVIANGAIN